MRGITSDDGRTAAVAANKSRGSSIAAPSATHGRAPRAAHSSMPAAHQACNRCAEQRPATVRRCCPYRATCARDSGTNRPAIAQRFARPAANIRATTLPHLLRNQCAGQRPLSVAMLVKRAHHARAYARSGGIGYPRMRASGKSSTTKHRLLHASGSHPIAPPNDPKTNQYNQDLGLIHSTNGNHLESPNEGSSIDHQVTIYLHAQNITMFPTNETRHFASQILVSNSGGLILILMAQSTRNEFRIHSDY
ncbi:F-box/LRR-repeat protein 15-like [Dorcoceras hygrometricum]|uniref:F-box/LRR-repeat protein 15-like n=1 Tax=Dorcoceras hygrometricum TaxID=472368 RepID=A0A2Z7D226_9LAMI|nr:F-box/LRR-repeat protein 15-like [Dorcoceras hygrometricum]